MSLIVKFASHLMLRKAHGELHLFWAIASANYLLGHSLTCFNVTVKVF